MAAPCTVPPVKRGSSGPCVGTACGRRLGHRERFACTPAPVRARVSGCRPADWPSAPPTGPPTRGPRPTPRTRPRWPPARRVTSRERWPGSCRPTSTSQVRPRRPLQQVSAPRPVPLRVLWHLTQSWKSRKRCWRGGLSRSPSRPAPHPPCRDELTSQSGCGD